MDYTRCEDKLWLYSQKTVDLVQEYALKFPKVFEMLNQQSKNASGFLFESDLAESIADETEEPNAKPLAQITRWLKEQPHNKALRRNAGSKTLDRRTIECVVEAVEKNKAQPVKSMKLQVKPHLLYKPNLNAISVRPDPKATYELFDRVVIARQGYSVRFFIPSHSSIIRSEPTV